MFITISARDYSSKGGTENSAFDASKKPEGMEARERVGFTKNTAMRHRRVG